MEDQKELASPVSPELRQKEVQMNFLNQLTSVFNPRTVPSPPISPQALVSSFAQISLSSCVKVIEPEKIVFYVLFKRYIIPFWSGADHIYDGGPIKCYFLVTCEHLGFRELLRYLYNDRFIQ